MVTNWLIGEAERERRDEVRQWLRDKLGRDPAESEIDQDWDEFELHEAYEFAMSKDD